jgi:hypothetical protein
MNEYGNMMAITKHLYEGPPTEDDLSWVRITLSADYLRCKEQDPTLPAPSFMTGPVVEVGFHHDEDDCFRSGHNPANESCPGCKEGLKLEITGYTYQYGWYAADGVVPQIPL